MVDTSRSRRASAWFSTEASAASTERRTRPQRSSSQEESKPACQMLNGAEALELVGVDAIPEPVPLAEEAALAEVAATPTSLRTPLALACSRVSEVLPS